MLRTTADVLDAHPLQRLLELRLASPHRVLPSVVGQHLGRLSVRRDASLERLHHQRRLLVVRKRVADHEAAVVVHEHADVQPLSAPKSKREDVRLPQLVRRRPLEPSRQVLALRSRTRCLNQTLVMQNPSYDLLGDSESLEPSQYVADSATPPLLVLLLQRDHLFALHRVGLRLRPVRGRSS